jgi:malate dehydrogenase (oxaloacetate-decarboxylating)
MTVEYPGTGYTVSIRLSYDNGRRKLANITTNIADAEGDITSVELVRTHKGRITRDITLNAYNEEHAIVLTKRLKKLKGVRVVAVSDPNFAVHLGGKIALRSRTPVKNHRDLAQVYTPGVGRVSSYIAKNKESVWVLTSKANTVAVVSDGTAVLGLGDIGPEAAMPVMEGKAILFKELGQVDAWPICLDTKDPDEIVNTVKHIAPGFGGINLEDISAPRCFYIEDRLKEELDIPVFHDDQHGTAVVVLAALINALKVTNRDISSIKAIQTGAGASGVATAKMLISAGLKDITIFDRKGAIHKDRGDIQDNDAKLWIAENTNPGNIVGSPRDALDGADLFLGLSGPGAVDAEDLEKMNSDGIVFALANPDPEVSPEEAHKYVRIVATGRSDYPNQINNALCFPGLFRGVLDVRATTINEEMKLAAAQALANTVPSKDLSDEYIIPSIFNNKVAVNVAKAVSDAALKTGVARRSRSHSGEHFPNLSKIKI